METTQKNTNNQNMVIPIAIIIAGALIAGGIYMSSRGSKIDTNQLLNKPTQSSIVEPITAADHVQGDPKTAKVTIIEYSDLECPFCKIYHATLDQVFAEYKQGGKVAWVYRHAPIVALHSKSPKEAEATECAAELGGNDVFWKYLAELFKNTPANNGLEMTRLYDFAETVGLDAKAFKKCLDGGKYATKINEQIVASTKAGASATPYAVLVVDGKNIPLVDKNGDVLGALRYDQMKQIIDQLIK